MGGIAPLRILDPLNISGVADYDFGSTEKRPEGGQLSSRSAILNQSGQSVVPAGSQVAKPASFQGFLAGLAPSRAGMVMHPGMVQMAPPPPSQWAYDPKKGASWATPQRKGTSQEYEMVNNAPGSEGFNSYRGNRI